MKGSGQCVKHSISQSRKGAIKGYKPIHCKIFVCYKISPKTGLKKGRDFGNIKTDFKQKTGIFWNGHSWFSIE
jgi:hypothetical protein